jgi:hypothetical protein
MSFSSALLALKDRIENWTPVKDPSIKFRYAEDSKIDNANRTFEFIELSTTCPLLSDGSPVTTEVLIKVHYERINYIWGLTSRMASDTDELSRRITYYLGNEWGGSTLTCTVSGYEAVIDREKQVFQLLLKVQLTYQTI